MLAGFLRFWQRPNLQQDLMQILPLPKLSRTYSLIPQRAISTAYCLLVTAGCASGTNGISGSDRALGQQRSGYVSINAAATQLSPVTEGTTFDLDESVSAGAGITLGYDLGRRSAVELSAQTLGTARLAPIATAGPGVSAQELEYSSIAGSVIYHLLGSPAASQGGSALSGFARVGLNQTTTAAEIDIESQDELQMFVGLGSQWMLGEAFGLRGELIAYDGDVSAANIGLVYRFVDQKPRRDEPLVKAEPVNEDTANVVKDKAVIAARSRYRGCPTTGGERGCDGPLQCRVTA